MHKELQKIRKQSQTILGDYPEKKADILDRIETARIALRRAEEAMEKAEGLEEYNVASEKAKQARLELQFTNKELDRMESAPRMKEGDYIKSLTACRGVMESAVKDYRTKALALMDQLKAVTDEYKQTAREVNETLIILDDVANVLQSKHPDRIICYKGLPDEKIRDRDMWRKYCLRYEPDQACKLATECGEDGKEVGHNYDSVLASAWRMINKAYPRISF